jgi:hypothetical protein
VCVSVFVARPGIELKALNLQSRLSTAWATPPLFFCSGYFEDRGLELFAWADFEIFQMSASQVAQIIGVSHWHLANTLLSDMGENDSSRNQGGGAGGGV